MGQHTSKKSAECTYAQCMCVWERRLNAEAPSSVHRYVSAVTDRWSKRECTCRRRRWRRPACMCTACVCTAYRRVNDDCAEERLSTALTLGARELRRELDAIFNNTDNDINREYDDSTPEVYMLSVTRNDGGFSQEGRRSGRSEFEVVCGSELRALLFRTQSFPHHALMTPTTVHTQVDYKHCLVPDLQEIIACSFYWGKMDRYEAERLLENKPEGTFLLRDSAQEEHLFSVSFRKYGRSLHARIEHHQHRFSFDSHDPAVFAAPTVTGLIEHYKDPACVMFFEPMLTAPLPRTSPFSLQQLARAVIIPHVTYDSVDQLPLPARLRAYLKEYHYRQRVRVRRLEPHVYDQEI